MRADNLTMQLHTLLAALAGYEIRRGCSLNYDGAPLHADEVADLMLPSVICRAQRMAEEVEFGSWGYRFAIVRESPGAFPLVMQREGSLHRFLEVAPFVATVFETQVMSCHNDLARFFENVARIIRPRFSLDDDSNHSELASGF
ncbi:MAG: hypothetical protein JWL65_145 [Gammaproteobacteria bacterium]|nr:hypothetical protein [Gammaproteobacteria bacterium]